MGQTLVAFAVPLERLQALIGGGDKSWLDRLGEAARVSISPESAATKREALSALLEDRAPTASEGLSEALEWLCGQIGQPLKGDEFESFMPGYEGEVVEAIPQAAPLCSWRAPIATRAGNAQELATSMLRLDEIELALQQLDEDRLYDAEAPVVAGRERLLTWLDTCVQSRAGLVVFWR